ncbi:MAG: hypothetical protein F4082_06980 [Gammaproteobacteria bacterium]|nr:hypothetical protein [Gammaproteobacteria bacterium]
MWAKRFPVPEFDRHVLKDMDWTAPEIKSGPDLSEYACVAVDADSALYERFSFVGDHLMAVACSLPDTTANIFGNSFAWPIQRALMLDSLDTENCQVIADWKTPRPMNTRFGPDSGITVNASQVFVLIGNQCADHWIANRIMLDNDWVSETGTAIEFYRQVKPK